MITLANLGIAINWAQTKGNPGTGGTIQNGYILHDLAGINLEEWDGIYWDRFDIGPTNPSAEIDLQDLENLVDSANPNELQRILVLYVKNLGEETATGIFGTDATLVNVAPGDTNPFTGFFTGEVPLPLGRAVCFSNSVFNFHESAVAAAAAAATSIGDGDVDVPVEPTARTIKLEYVDGGNTTIEIFVLGSTLITG